MQSQIHLFSSTQESSSLIILPTILTNSLTVRTYCRHLQRVRPQCFTMAINFYMPFWDVVYCQQIPAIFSLVCVVWLGSSDDLLQTTVGIHPNPKTQILYLVADAKAVITEDNLLTHVSGVYPALSSAFLFFLFNLTLSLSKQSSESKAVSGATQAADDTNQTSKAVLSVTYEENAMLRLW